MQSIDPTYILGDTVKVENEDGYIVPGYIAEVTIEDSEPAYLVKTNDGANDEGMWCTSWDFI